MKASPKRSAPNASNSSIPPMTATTAAVNGMAKPKQSKSRNGCVTCKAKRLKCDESKPSCQQCHKRGVQCGGYKKDFKWRPFEESNFTNKAPAKAKKATPSPPGSKYTDNGTPLSSPALSESSISTNSPDDLPFIPLYPQAPALQVDPTFHSSTQAPSFQPHLIGNVLSQGGMMNFIPTPYLQMPDQAGRGMPRSHPANYPQVPISDSDLMFSGSAAMPPSSLSSSFSGQSPKLIDLLLPGTDLNARPMGFMGYESNHLDMSYQSTSQSEMLPTPPTVMEPDDDFDEEIIRALLEPTGQWAMRLPSPSPSTSSVSSSGSSPSRARMFGSPFSGPRLAVNSPEMLMMSFDRQTCGILSIKDGPNENPWRTLIWPLARESPALYHAVYSMTAFHQSREQASLRVDGMEHMRESIRVLAAGLENMRTDAALATTLALAFSESWDQHISTGIEHLRGARVLVDQAVIKHRQNELTGDDLARLKFLCNTFVYMDVIARLTSEEEDEASRSDTITPQYCGPFSGETEIDPLMGCATSLFPLIGSVANLARRIRKSESTTVLMIEQGMELKTRIQNWRPGTQFVPPEDPTSDIQHCIQTAEAYRWATLLYLHQALPEIPSPTTAQLAKKVLVYLATVPVQSRTIIIHIYPLLIAGCEAVGSERDWVKNRWEAMIRRLAIGNVDKCWDITKEVWDRRDKDQAERARARSPANDSMRSNSPVKRKYAQDEEEREEEEDGRNSPYQFQQISHNPLGYKKRATSGDRSPPKACTMDSKAMGSLVDAYTEDMDYDMTVRGRLHWAGVMKEWNWEVLLG